MSFPIASLRVSLNGANAVAAVATAVIFQWLLTYHPKFSSDIRTASSVEDGCSRRPCDKFTDHISCSSGSISSTEQSCDFAIWNDPLFTKQWRVCACALDDVYHIHKLKCHPSLGSRSDHNNLLRVESNEFRWRRRDEAPFHVTFIDDLVLKTPAFCSGRWPV